MTHTYQISNITCGSCEAKVKGGLLKLPDVMGVEISNNRKEATISMNKHISLSTLQEALPEKYQLSAVHHSEMTEQAKSWFNTYKPVLLLFAYITTVSIIAAAQHGTFHWMQFMNVFMAGFFLSFSFFKLINLQAFAESYAMYDVVAKQWKQWGYVYAFIELVLGISFAVNFQPLLTNIVTLIVMSVSIIGVMQSVLNKRKIQCACLGAVFNLPMSTITIIEDAVMILMSAVMIYSIIF